ncbi:TIGR03619 family F420-dependent LLM class oxidoreductase [Pseudonocardia xinjiangensis]|uniref:TIGR03619 family F420-dependent LLM class oxidoreductase n=1 Tax=Pseudonocardia xinjiangensis TaxID=75289 RepID=UPI003D8D37C7
MRFGLGLPQRTDRYDIESDVARIARGAERAGYSSLWVYERVLFPLPAAGGRNGVPGLPWSDGYRTCADPFTVLALASVATQDVRLGTCVIVAPLHSSLHLARALATLDLASGGRVVAGFGCGTSSDEYRGAGADFVHRGRSLDEAVDACRALWGPDPVSYRDSRMVIENALVSPKPAAPLPVLLGDGTTRRSIERIAGKADGWLPVGTSAGAIEKGWKQIRDRAAELGRDPGLLELIPRANVVFRPPVARADRQPFHGSLQQVVDDIADLAELGATEVLIDLTWTARGGEELLDLALQVLGELDAAGLH